MQLIFHSYTKHSFQYKKLCMKTFWATHYLTKKPVDVDARLHSFTKLEIVIESLSKLYLNTFDLYDFIWEFCFSSVFLDNTGFDLIFRDQTRIKILFWISGEKPQAIITWLKFGFAQDFFFSFLSSASFSVSDFCWVFLFKKYILFCFKAHCFRRKKERYLSVCHLIVKNGRSVYTNWMRCLDPYNIVRMLRGPGLFSDSVHKFVLAPAKNRKKWIWIPT